uniref:G_PROTEIN_RECEP_F1_2 domain-containing protein n=1 Tax=Macrostomum lignano TaxID=282301 RepID=A0A1I8F8I9_9PLAT
DRTARERGLNAESLPSVPFVAVVFSRGRGKAQRAPVSASEDQRGVRNAERRIFGRTSQDCRSFEPRDRKFFSIQPANLARPSGGGRRFGDQKRRSHRKSAATRKHGDGEKVESGAPVMNARLVIRKHSVRPVDHVRCSVLNRLDTQFGGPSASTAIFLHTEQGAENQAIVDSTQVHSRDAAHQVTRSTKTPSELTSPSRATWLLSMAIALPIGCGTAEPERHPQPAGVQGHVHFLPRRLPHLFEPGQLLHPLLVMLVLYYRIFKVIWRRAKKAASTRKGCSGCRGGGGGGCGGGKVYTNCKAASTATAAACNDNAATAGQRQGRAATTEAPEVAPEDEVRQALVIVHASPRRPPNNLSLSLSRQGSRCGRQNSSSLSRGQQRDLRDPVKTTATVRASPLRRRGSRNKQKKQKKQQLDSSWAKKAFQLNFAAQPGQGTGGAVRGAREEKKATKTLAIVLVGPCCNYDRRIGVFIVWLGYVNSTLNR